VAVHAGLPRRPRRGAAEGARDLSLRVATLNVNGIRAAQRRGLAAWLSWRRPDVLLLQEVRAPAAHVETLAGAGGLLGEFTVVHDEGDRLGRNGVAVLAAGTLGRDAVRAVRVGPACPEFDRTGRWLEVDLAGCGGPDALLTAVSVYVPTGEAGTVLQDVKQRFLDAMTARLADLGAAAAAGGAQVIVGGDLNVGAEDADIKAWRANLRHSGFLPAERDWLRSLTAGSWVDLVRAAHPEAAGPYSWWSWRGRAFDNDAGWRIDALLATPAVAARTRAAWVDRAASHAERLSDHAPVLAHLD